MLWTAYSALDGEDISALPSVFATQGGESEVTLELLQQLAKNELLSPLKFGLSVHNASAGLFSIASKNKSPSTTIASGNETFACGLCELLTQLVQQTEDEILLVAADEWMPEILRNNYVPRSYHYSLALLISKSTDFHNLEISYSPNARLKAQPPQEELPQPLEFIRWMLSGEDESLLEAPSFSLRCQKKEGSDLLSLCRSQERAQQQ